MNEDPPRAAYVPLTRDPLRVRSLRLLRALMVGAVATLADFTVLTVCIRLVHLEPSIARAPALFTGALVQFLGNRWFTFRAQSGAISRHARLFLAFESLAYLGNLLVYRYLVRAITVLPPELVSFVGTFVIFVGYSYPIRRLVVFRLLQTEYRERGLAAGRGEAAPQAPDASTSASSRASSPGSSAESSPETSASASEGS